MQVIAHSFYVAAIAALTIVAYLSIQAKCHNYVNPSLQLMGNLSISAIDKVTAVTVVTAVLLNFL